jgi:hypothetical protein
MERRRPGSLALTRSPRSDLGSFAQSVETAPVETLTTTGAFVGLLWGTLVGFGLAAIARSEEPGIWALGTGALGAVAMGAQGYAQGQELKSWLAQY